MKNYLPTLFAIILAVALAAFTNPAKKHHSSGYYFEFNGTSNGEGNPYNWHMVYDPTGCFGNSRSCKIEIDPQYVIGTCIDATMLPNERLPIVTGSPGYHVPDPMSSIYLTIYNQLPE